MRRPDGSLSKKDRRALEAFGVRPQSAPAGTLFHDNFTRQTWVAIDPTAWTLVSSPSSNIALVTASANVSWTVHAGAVTVTLT